MLHAALPYTEEYRIGGGVDVRLWKGLAVGGDVRYLRLFDDTEGFDFAFVTSQICYRF